MHDGQECRHIEYKKKFQEKRRFGLNFHSIAIRLQFSALKVLIDGNACFVRFETNFSHFMNILKRRRHHHIMLQGILLRWCPFHYHSYSVLHIWHRTRHPSNTNTHNYGYLTLQRWAERFSVYLEKYSFRFLSPPLPSLKRRTLFCRKINECAGRSEIHAE